MQAWIYQQYFFLFFIPFEVLFIIPNTANMRLEREEMWIRKLATKRPNGLNKND
jgi:hypothetical protein